MACGSSDTFISILTYTGDKWEPTKFPAHKIGVNAVSWAPAFAPSLGSIPSNPVKRLVSGGCDHLVKIWKYNFLNLIFAELIMLFCIDLKILGKKNMSWNNILTGFVM